MATLGLLPRHCGFKYAKPSRIALFGRLRWICILPAGHLLPLKKQAQLRHFKHNNRILSVQLFDKRDRPAEASLAVFGVLASGSFQTVYHCFGSFAELLLFQCYPIQIRPAVVNCLNFSFLRGSSHSHGLQTVLELSNADHTNRITCD